MVVSGRPGITVGDHGRLGDQAALSPGGWSFRCRPMSLLRPRWRPPDAEMVAGVGVARIPKPALVVRSLEDLVDTSGVLAGSVTEPGMFPLLGQESDEVETLLAGVERQAFAGGGLV